jgi:hypothetical protein
MTSLLALDPLAWLYGGDGGVDADTAPIFTDPESGSQVARGPFSELG